MFTIKPLSSMSMNDMLYIAGDFDAGDNSEVVTVKEFLLSDKYKDFLKGNSEIELYTAKQVKFNMEKLLSDWIKDFEDNTYEGWSENVIQELYDRVETGPFITALQQTVDEYPVYEAGAPVKIDFNLNSARLALSAIGANTAGLWDESFVDDNAPNPEKRVYLSPWNIVNNIHRLYFMSPVKILLHSTDGTTLCLYNEYDDDFKPAIKKWENIIPFLQFIEKDELTIGKVEIEQVDCHHSIVDLYVCNR